MKPEADRYLDKARQSLAHARAIFAIDLGEEAGRAAYLGAFHAAQALIFERTNRAAKTHGASTNNFSGWLKTSPELIRIFAAFFRKDTSLRRSLTTRQVQTR